MKKNLKPVELESRFYEILGENATDIPIKERRERWERWKEIAIEKGKQNMVDHWSKDHLGESGCLDCSHRDDDWCKYQELPCSVNPILTFRYGHIGMACYGVCFQGRQMEMEL